MFTAVDILSAIWARQNRGSVDRPATLQCSTVVLRRLLSISARDTVERCYYGCWLITVPAKRLQHANATYRNIVGRNMLHAFGQRVAMCCDMLGVVGSSLKMVKFEPTTHNMSQNGGQTHAACWSNNVARGVSA